MKSKKVDVFLTRLDAPAVHATLSRLIRGVDGANRAFGSTNNITIIATTATNSTQSMPTLVYESAPAMPLVAPPGAKKSLARQNERMSINDGTHFAIMCAIYLCMLQRVLVPC